MENKSQEASVPVFITGFITIFEGVDICMDSADFRLHAFMGEIRVKAANDEVNEFLNQAANTHRNILIAGKHVESPEGKNCHHVSAYFADDFEDAAAKIGISSKN